MSAGETTVVTLQERVERVLDKIETAQTKTKAAFAEVDKLYEQIDRVVTNTFNREFKDREDLIMLDLHAFAIDLGTIYGEVVKLEMLQFIGRLHYKLHPELHPEKRNGQPTT